MYQIEKFYKALLFNPFRSSRGFTLYELMIVVAIIGALAAIAIPNFLKYRYNSYDVTAKNDIKNAYSISQIYFSDNEIGSITGVDQIKSYGFKQTAHVLITIQGNVDTLEIMTKHLSGNTIYSMNSDGTILP